MLRPSKFNVSVPLKSGEFLIFNTVSKSQIIIDQEARDSIYGSSPDNKEDAVFQELEDLGIMVDERVDEDRQLEYNFQQFRYGNREMFVTILTTYGCNLDCVYCSQEGIDRQKSMSDSKAADTVNWIKRKLETVRPETLNVTFFGGEPLLNPQALFNLSKSIYKVCEEKGVRFEAGIITNGTLITPEIISELKNWGLKGVKITLDGDEEIHDRKRPTKVGGGSYRTIVENMKRIKGMIPISLNGNFDSENKGRLSVILDELVAEGFTGEDIVKIAFKPIMTNLESTTKGEGACGVCTFSSIDPEDFIYLRREIRKRGFEPAEGVVLGPCEAARENAFTIDPFGKIYKCGAFVGREEFVIGDVETDSMNFRNTEFMTLNLWNSGCGDCAYMPICGGGCRASAQVSSGNFQNPSCEKEYFQNTASRILEEEAALV